MENITADGKIKTIRCVKATHEDFAKLVNLGKEAKKELEILVEKWGNIEHIKEMTQKDACHVIDQKENKQFNYLNKVHKNHIHNHLAICLLS